MTFRIAGDEDERNWPLTPMPLIIGAEEWARVERGLDPARDAARSDRCRPLRRCRRWSPKGGFRRPRSCRQPLFRAQDAGGQAPERTFHPCLRRRSRARAARPMARAERPAAAGDRHRLCAGEPAGDVARHRRSAARHATSAALADFFASLREGIARDCPRERPRIALLTPGPLQPELSRAGASRALSRLSAGRGARPRRYRRPALRPHDRRAQADRRGLALDRHQCSRSAELRFALAARRARPVRCVGAAAGWRWPTGRASKCWNRRPSPHSCHACAGVCWARTSILPNVATWWCGQRSEARPFVRGSTSWSIVPAFGQPVEGLPAGLPIAGREPR